MYKLLLEHGASEIATPWPYDFIGPHPPLLRPREIYNRIRRNPEYRDEYGTRFTYGQPDGPDDHPNGTEVSDYEDSSEDDDEW